MEDFLSNREMRTVIKDQKSEWCSMKSIEDQKSEWCSMKSRVPQELVLVPLMFLVYVSDRTENE